MSVFFGRLMEKETLDRIAAFKPGPFSQYPVLNFSNVNVTDEHGHLCEIDGVSQSKTKPKMPYVFVEVKTRQKLIITKTVELFVEAIQIMVKQKKIRQYHAYFVYHGKLTTPAAQLLKTHKIQAISLAELGIRVKIQPGKKR